MDPQVKREEIELLGWIWKEEKKSTSNQPYVKYAYSSNNTSQYMLSHFEKRNIVHIYDSNHIHKAEAYGNLDSLKTLKSIIKSLNICQ